jgi:hypothetical protein
MEIDERLSVLFNVVFPNCFSIQFAPNLNFANGDAPLLAFAQRMSEEKYFRKSIHALKIAYNVQVLTILLLATDEKFLHLRELDLADCYSLNTSHVQLLGSAAPNLTALRLCYCAEVSDSDLQIIATTLPGLTRLDLGAVEKITDVGLCHLASSSSSLKSTLMYLNLCWDSKITNEGLNYLSEFSSLTELHIAGLIAIGDIDGLCRSLERAARAHCVEYQNERLRSEAFEFIIESDATLDWRHADFE